jgi:cyclopropane fatty-acyl-phospholipid synthase-like methyltransferase
MGKRQPRLARLMSALAGGTGHAMQTWIGGRTAMVKDEGTCDAALRPIVRYYDDSWIDYRSFWLNDQNRAIHFGYHDRETRSHSESLQHTNRVLANIAGIRRQDRVLDAGCGIGGSSIWIAANLGCTVTGITPVQSQIDRARLAVRQCALDTLVTIERADYTATPYEDQSFDVVWALESVCHARSKSAFYREASRLLRPGGRLIIAEYVRNRRGFPEQDERLLKEWLGGWAIPDIDTKEEHASNAAAAGFTNIEIRDVTARMHKSLRRAFLLSAAAILAGHLMHWLNLRNDVLHGNLIGAHRQYLALGRDLWFYAFLSAVKA